MTFRFSTRRIHEGGRFRAHAEAIEDVYRLKLDRQATVALCDGVFDADIDGVKIGAIGLSVVNARAHRVRHLVSSQPQLRDRYLQFNLLRSGSGTLRQDGREARLAAGDLFLYETHRPFDLTYAQDFEVCVIGLPCELLARDLPEPAAVTARVVHRDAPMGAVVNQYFDRLLAQLGCVGEAAAARLANAGLQLLAGAVGELDAGGRRRRPTRERLRVRAQQLIEDHLHEGDLNVQRVAARMQVSTSYLRALFAEVGESVSASIAQRRLERCRCALADPAQSGRSIGEIAYDCGFNSPAHLSHRFRREYGMAPSEYRHAAAGRGAGEARRPEGAGSGR